MPRKYIYFLIIKKKKEEIVNVNNDEEIFSDKISLHNDKYDDSINLDGVCRVTNCGPHPDGNRRWAQ